VTRLVHWQEGMLMRAHNLQMLQQGFLDRLEDVRRLQPHFPYGIVEAEIARDALEMGKVRFVRLRAVLLSGLEFVAPTECELGDLPVRQELAKSRSGEVTILLGVPDYSEGLANSFRENERPDSRVKYRYIPRSETRRDENTGDNQQTVVVRMLNARLLFEHEDRSGLECLPVVRVRRASAGTGADFRVEIATGFVPPCLFLPPPGITVERAVKEPGPQAVLADISLPHRLSEEVHLSVQKVEIARRLQSVRLQNQRLTMAALQGAQFQQWMRFLSLTRNAARLLTLAQSPHLTPFEMFAALYETLCELEALRPRRDTGASRVLKETGLKYEHDDPYSTFSRLRGRLEKALLDVGGVDHHPISFTPDASGQNRVRASLGAQFFGPDIASYYLAIQTPLSLLDLKPVVEKRRHFELTTPANLDQGWGGLQLVHEPDPPTGLDDAPDLHYFKIERTNDPVLRQVWETVESVGELGISLNNPHLNLTNATFTFYAVLQPRAVDPDTGV